MARALALLCVIVGPGLAVAGPDMEVFVAPGQEIVGKERLEEGVSVSVYDMGAVERFEKRLSEGLPSKRREAKKEAKRRIEALGSDRQSRRKRLESIYEGLIRAYRMDVDRLPAVVFDGDQVVYGVTDLRVALEHYRRWRDGR